MSAPSIGAVPQGSSTNPCCCAPPPSCTLYFQTKSGTATLCGISEYTTPSSPPKKYLTQTASGGYVHCDSAFANCSDAGLHNVTSHRYQGSWTYTASTCTDSNGQQGASGNVVGGGCVLGGVGAYSTITPKDTWSPADLSTATITTTRIQVQFAWANVCDGAGNLFDGNVFKTLSNEDTEDAAIARANALIGSWTPCTVTVPGDCSAQKTLRSAGSFSMTYRTSQYQVGLSGGVIGAAYAVTVQYQRRVKGSGAAFVDWATNTVFVTMTTDPIRDSVWYQIPCDSGFEVIASSCSAVRVS